MQIDLKQACKIKKAKISDKELKLNNSKLFADGPAISLVLENVFRKAQELT